MPLLIITLGNKTVLHKTLVDIFSYISFLSLSCSFKRYLTEKVVPGNRVTVMGIYSIKKVAQKNDKVRCSKSKERNDIGSSVLTVVRSVKRIKNCWV